MKKLALVFLLAASPLVRADDKDLLQNGDFSSGIAHWEGDCHTPGNNDAPPDFTANPATDAPKAAQGVYVKLRHNDWTKMTQDFDGKAGQYLLRISYSFSPETKLSTAPADYANIPVSTGMSLFRPFSTQPGKWVLVMCDTGAGHFTYWEVSPKAHPGAAETQSFAAQVPFKSDDEEKKIICLVFPPGDGIVTIQNVSLARR